MAGRAEKRIALARAIRELREERGTDAGDLAAAAGIDPGDLEAIEAGRVDPPYELLGALADGLGVSLSAIVTSAERGGDLDPRAVAVAFGRRLREVRTERGLSQDDLALADRVGMRGTVIGRLEHGDREPRLTTVLRLARGLDVTPGELVDELDAPAGGEA
jgi:transcriptional regulator with XRE-family HTH domain